VQEYNGALAPNGWKRGLDTLSVRTKYSCLLRGYKKENNGRYLLGYGMFVVATKETV
jgi:hypothetical protein